VPPNEDVDENLSVPASAQSVAEYRRLCEARKRDLALEQRRSDRLGNLRLLLVLVAATLLILPLFLRHGGPWWALLALLAGFVWLGNRHDRVQRRVRSLSASVTFFGRELDRLEERWRDLPDTGADLDPVLSEELAPDSDAQRVQLAHLAGDLDVFGPASLFQLLCRAVTRNGRVTLSRWLLEGAPREEALARQEAVRELSSRMDLRERFYVAASGDGHALLEPRSLLEWGEHPSPLPYRGILQVIAFVQPALLVAAAVGVVFGLAPSVLLVVALVHLAIFSLVRKSVTERLQRLFSPDRTLLRYADLIDEVEGAKLSSARLEQVQAALATDGVTASERLRQLRRISERLEWNLNIFFALSFGPVLFWDLHHVLQAERWQARTGPRLRAWFAALGEMEALASLGGFAFERPDYAYPLLLEEEGTFAARGLSHPLLRRGRACGNDLTLGGPGTVLILSGSNMSGKSTLLRSVGVNQLLARAGAPVAASELRLSPFELVTSIRVVDSLSQGTSHFYAELQRIREALVRARARGPQLMYLLDEMLHGTNSKERYVGAVSVIRWMSEQRCQGIVTTHDLALARVSEVLPPGAVSNKHFGDSVVGNEIRFDYVLREGPVETTNALRLMKAIGIDIELSAPELQ
jgi:hypothetical protein